MNQEQVIELAEESGFPIAKQHGTDDHVLDEFIGVVDDARDLTRCMARFASLVEQATLERAAKVCDEQSTRLTGAGVGSILCANAIRALKTNQE